MAIKTDISERLKSGLPPEKVVELLGLDPAEYLSAVDDEPAVIIPGLWYAEDPYTDGVYIEADTAEAAAAEWVVGYELADDTDASTTNWVTVTVYKVALFLEDGVVMRASADDTEVYITTPIPPDEPDCEDPEGHDWKSPYDLLGGLKENPGVWGKGGGVVITEVCERCGIYRVTDTWSQNRETGEQGLRSITYRDADSASAEWVRQHKIE